MIKISFLKKCSSFRAASYLYALTQKRIAMEKDLKELLEQVLANQVVIYKRLEEIEYKVKGGFKSAPLKDYVKELRDKSNKVLPLLNEGD
jgi:hypothetical protein